MENLQGREEKEDVNFRSVDCGSPSSTPMAQSPRDLIDYALPPMDVPPVIWRSAIQANNFGLKLITLQLIQNIQFIGFPQEDPNTRISNFLELCDTIKYNGVSEDAIRLRLFPFSLKDKEKHWLNSKPPNSVTTWAELVQKFLAKFFPTVKTTRMRIEINNFAQLEGESFLEAWDRYKDLLREYPRHSLPKWMQVHHFHNGLNGTTRTLLDALAGGVLMRKSEDEAYQLLENMAINNCQWPSEKATPKKSTGMYEVDVFSNWAA